MCVGLQFYQSKPMLFPQKCGHLNRQCRQQLLHVHLAYLQNITLAPSRPPRACSRAGAERNAAQRGAVLAVFLPRFRLWPEEALCWAGYHHCRTYAHSWQGLGLGEERTSQNNRQKLEQFRADSRKTRSGITVKRHPNKETKNLKRILMTQRWERMGRQRPWLLSGAEGGYLLVEAPQASPWAPKERHA